MGRVKGVIAATVSRRFALRLHVLALACFLGACGGTVAPGTDAGSQADAGADAGSQADAGADAGAQADAGSGAGAQVDAGTDAGSQPDAGTDAGAQADGGYSTTPLDTAVLLSALGAAEKALTDIIAATADHAERNKRMAAWLQARPEFAEAGISGDGVWGRLVNGQVFVATSSLIAGETQPVPPVPAPRPLPRPGRSAAADVVENRAGAAAAAPPSLPAGAQARVLLSLDPDYPGLPNDRITGMLRDRGYSVLNQRATVANLRAVSGDAVFYWGSHGTTGKYTSSGGTYWAVSTADDVTDAANLANKADLDDGSLWYFAATQRFTADGKPVVRTRYAMMPGFIAKYHWSFTKDSLLFLNSCYSDADGFGDALAARGGNVTFGWSEAVAADAAWKAALYAFDRLLGANQVDPKEAVPQRPFDSDAVFADMNAKHLDDGHAGNCKLVSRRNVPVALAPSVQRMELGERLQEGPLRGASKLTLVGIFGSEQGTVKVGGVEVPIKSWATDKIEVEPADLPGPGFSGEVQTFAQERKGNQVPLTQWHGTLTYSVDLLAPQASNAVSTIACDVTFRGDVHKYREAPGQDPVQPKVANVRAAQGSSCHWQVTGSPPQGTSWVGPLSESLPFGLNGTVNSPYGDGYIVSAALDAQNKTANFSFNFLSCVAAYQAGPRVSQFATLHDQLLTSQASGVGNDGYPLYANNLNGTLGADFVIPARSITGSTTQLDAKLDWTDFVPANQPQESKGEDDAQQ